MLDMRHLRSLIAIAETRKLSSAAERVYLSQSALSHQIRKLEAHYGVVLFERSRTGLTFTPYGERLLQLARTVVTHIQDAERDLIRLQGDTRGELRIALECHTCFDWLMPVMDEFRRRWGEVNIDLVAGFHSDPISLLNSDKADLIIGAKPTVRQGLRCFPLFRFEIMIVMENEHALRDKPYVQPRNLIGETLITYPVPETRIDLVREILAPKGIKLPRRTAELTIAIMQLVASKRGIAALPNWGIKNYVEHDYIRAKRIGKHGLWSELHATCTPSLANKPYLQDFLGIIKNVCATQLDGIELLA